MIVAIGSSISTALATLLIAITVCTTSLTAQAAGTIRGTVTAANSMRPLSGAQVSVPGTGRGSLTNSQGEFLIVNVPAGPQTVRVQMLGFGVVEKEVEVQAGGAASVDFQLAEQALALDEVVVTGTAGQARRREVGNSISQINTSAVTEPLASVDNLLSGRAAGVAVLPGGGMAGSGSQIRLRGNTSVSMSNQPLIYVDGVRIPSEGYPKNVPPVGYQGRGANTAASPLNDINPADIDRIEVIKGAAATTLYGTEAAAGVIQIFTKRGAAGQARWTAQVDQGFSEMQPFGPDNEPYVRMEPWLRRAWQQKYALSVAGGVESITYFLSGTWDDNEGVLPNDTEDRRVVRGNLRFSPRESLNLDWNTSYTRGDISNTPMGDNAQGIGLNAYYGDNNYFGEYSKEAIDQLLDFEINTYIDHITTGLTASHNPTESFSHRFTVGFDRAASELRQVRPFGFVFAPLGIMSDRRWVGETLTLDYAATLNIDLPGELRSSLSTGGQMATTEESSVYGYAEGFPGPGVPTLSSGSSTLAFEDRLRVINAGLFVQNLLDWKDRYFLTTGVRVDGNSAFGENLGLQAYPKVSLSYVVSDEPFWRESMGTLKLRAALGYAGRAPGAFDAVRTWAPVGWGNQPAFWPNTLGNEDLGPERTREVELGFDGSFLNDRLTTEFTYYNQRTRDALLPVRQIPSMGDWGSQLENVGVLANRGMELALNAVLLTRPDFSWDAGVTVATNHSEVLDLGGAAAFSINGGGWVQEGGPVPAVRGRKVTNPDELAEPEIVLNHVFGPNLPTRIVGVNSSLSLPFGVHLSALGEYMGGHYIEDNASGGGGGNAQRGVWPACQGPGGPYELIASGQRDQLTALQRARCDPALQRGAGGNLFVYPADFFKLRHVTLQAPLPFRMPGNSNATLTASARNTFRWLNDDFPIFDPEMVGNEGMHTRTRSIQEHIPTPATYTLSLRVTF